MKRRYVFAGLATVAVMASFAFDDKAYGHHPLISATASCQNDQSVVDIDVESWNDWDGQPVEDDHRYNPDILVTYNDGTMFDSELTIGHGAFLPENQFRFSMELLHAPGGTITVTATAAAPFGPKGEFGSQGESRSVIVELPTDCRTPQATTTSTGPAPTTTASGSTTTTSFPPQGTTIVRDIIPATPIEMTPRFTG